MEDEIRVHVIEQSDRKHLSMRYVDPITRKHVKRTTGTADKKQAERVAHKREADLNAGRYFEPSNMSWVEFRERYEEEKLSTLAVVHSETLSCFQARLRKERNRDRQQRSEATIGAYLAHLRAALRWAVEMGMLPAVPKISKPKRARGRSPMRGQPGLLGASVALARPAPPAPGRASKTPRTAETKCPTHQPLRSHLEAPSLRLLAGQPGLPIVTGAVFGEKCLPAKVTMRVG